MNKLIVTMPAVKSPSPTWRAVLAALLCALLLPAGCGNNLPFSYRYTSPREVIVTYQGKSYTLNMSSKNTQVPFGYQFEADGDVDITIAGQTYEIDSPYDKDRKSSKSSVKKKTARKK